MPDDGNDADGVTDPDGSPDDPEGGAPLPAPRPHAVATITTATPTAMVIERPTPRLYQGSPTSAPGAWDPGRWRSRVGGSRHPFATR